MCFELSSFKRVESSDENIKIKNRRPDQTVVKRFGPVRSSDLNCPVRSEKFSDRNF